MADGLKNGDDIDPMEGLLQLEKLISEAQEYDTKQKVTFNGNKMLNDLLDKPMAVDKSDANSDGQHSDEDMSNDDNNNVTDEEEKDENEEQVDEMDEDADDEHENDNRKGIKRTKSSSENISDEEINVKKTPNKTPKNKNKRSKSQKKKKSTNPTHRKNIKTILKEEELDKETQLARKEEEERIARQKERTQQRLLELQQRQLPMFGSPVELNANITPKRDLSDEILLSSDEEEEKQKFNNLSLNKSPFASHDMTEIIDLSSSDDEEVPKRNYNSQFNPTYNPIMTGDDDDISIIDSADIDPDSNLEDVNNCGLHTDDSLNQPDSQGRVLVNVHHPPDDPDIYLAPQIARRVKPHQIGGIRFLYDNLVESIDRMKKSHGFGCILSHSMGLGKTMQVISFIDVFLTHTDAQHVLCIVPINTLQNWISEFNMWLPEEGGIEKFFKKTDISKEEVKFRTFKVFAINEAKSLTTRAKTILSWRKVGGVLLLGYEMYRILTAVNNKNKSKKDEDINPNTLNEINSQIRQALIDPGPDLVVCDEGHRIKNCNAATSMALKNIKTRRRIVLTGYPLQNKLLEYWCMVDFVRPNFLGQKNEFTNMFERPITNGQCIDSTPQDRQMMKYRAHVLYQLLRGFVQRRSHSVLKTALPDKCEYVVMCRMTAIQKQLMLAFLDTAINDPDAIGTVKGRISTLTLFAVCCKVWNHPDIVYDIIRKGLASDDFDVDYTTKNKTQTKKNPKKKETIGSPPDVLPFDDPLNNFDDVPINLFDQPLRTKNDGVLDWSWADSKLFDYVPGLIDNSFKMIILFDIIEECMAIGDRLLVFSQSLLTLDVIERFLQSRDIPNTRTKWAKNQSYYRLDGSTSTQEREKYINLFNNTDSAHIFLISTRAGSLGINLIGANRIVIFDASWNPCHDAQAACRIYRYGQPKPCFIYRLICDNSLEKKIYDRQVNKQGMANRVVDEQNTEPNFTWREIHSLMDDLREIREPPIEVYTDEQLAKYDDQLIRNICSKDNHCITRLPFEHESLLLDRKEEKLSSAEKKIAFGHYKEAKRLKNMGMDYSSAMRNPMAARNFPNYQMPYPYSPYPLPTQMTPNPNQLMNTMSYPDISQPLPPYPPQARGQSSHQFMNFESIAETLVRNGNSVKKVLMPSDLSINVGPNSTVNIKRGEEVMVIQTPKGLYLRTNEGNIISIKNTANPFGSHNIQQNNFSSFLSAANRIIQPNLQCGGTVHCSSTPTHSRASSTVSHPPEVVQLSDDEDSPDAIDRALDQTVNLSTCSEPSFGDSVHNSIDSPAAKRQPNQTTSNSNSIASETDANDRSHDFSGLNDPTFTTPMDSSAVNTALSDTSFQTAAMDPLDFDSLEI